MKNWKLGVGGVRGGGSPPPGAISLGGYLTHIPVCLILWIPADLHTGGGKGLEALWTHTPPPHPKRELKTKPSPTEGWLWAAMS